MGLFNNQFANVVEWPDADDSTIFYKWHNSEIKKDSRLVIRPGQDAVLLYNGRIEGVFTNEGNYEIESDIIPFLSTLKGFKFGFNSGLRAEVLFVNTRELTVRWGTHNSINIPAPGLPGGMPIKAFGTFQIKVSDYIALIDQIAGVQELFTVEALRDRMLPSLHQLLMRWIVQEGKDMFNLQANAAAISSGIRTDLDMELSKIGLSVTGFSVSSFSYPEEVQRKIDKTASYSMVGDTDRYQKVGMVDAMTSAGNSPGGTSAAGDAMGSAAGLAMGLNLVRETFSESGARSASGSAGQPAAAASCQSCGKPIDANANFCPHCGAQQQKSCFCPSCGEKVPAGAKFCPACGKPADA